MLLALTYSAPGHAEDFAQYLTPAGDKCLTLAKGFDKATDKEFYMVVNRAASVCFKKYGPRSPCLVKLEKVGPNDYNATCGAKL